MSEKQFALHRQIHYPTGVTHSACAFFTRLPSDETSVPNLILIRSTLLEVYELGLSPTGSPHLELIDNYPLNGVVESLVVLQNPSKQTQRDSLILTFREAKVTVLEWNTSVNSISVSSLHSFEKELQNKDGKEVFPLGPEAKTDPLGRCACVLFFENRLALLPTRDLEDLDVPMMEARSNLVSPAAAVSGSYILQLQTLGIREVLDFVFLRGYNEPVILLLHEASPTWAAQYREKKDTRCLTAVSLNLKQKIYPVIWSVKGLPSDAYKLIPAPIAGALVLSMNFISFYSQGQTVAVGTNSQAFPVDVGQKVEAEGSTESQSSTTVHFARTHATAVHPNSAPALSLSASQEVALEVELDAAVACWLNKMTMLLALKTGQLLLVQLIIDRDNIKDITLNKCGGAPLVSCLTVLSEDLLFIGSCQGDSLLVKFNPLKEQTLPAEDPVSSSLVLDDDDLMFLTEEATPLPSAGLSDHQFSFSVVDSLVCIGPIRDMVTGAPSELDSGTQQTSLSPQLVCCAGTGRSGCLTILRKGIVAEVLIEVPVPDIEAVWALHYTEESEHLSVSLTSYATNAFLVISTSAGTMVLRSGEELEEVSDKSDFEVGKKTVLAGSLLEHTRLIQVCEESIRVLRGTQLVQEIHLTELLQQLGQDAPQQETAEEVSSPKEVSPEPMQVDSTKQEQRNLFYDFGSLAEDSLPADFLMDEKTAGVDNAEADLMSISQEQETKKTGPWIQSASICDPLILLRLADGRVILLEGDKESKTLSPLETSIELLFNLPTENEPEQITSGALFSDTTLWLNSGRESAIYQNPVFCLICRMNGILEIYALPHMNCIFALGSFSIGWRILKGGDPQQIKEKISTENRPGSSPRVVEIRMDCFMEKTGQTTGESLISKPFLCALLEDSTLLLYSAFHDPENHLCFRRVDLDYTGDAAWVALHSKDRLRALHRRPKLVSFLDMGEKYSYNGIFISGVAPYFLLFSTKGVFLHRLLVDGPVSAMTPFSNINCPKGFILAMTNNQLKICTLHKERMDGCWPYTKIPLRCTPSKVAWYPDCKLYLLLTSRSVLFRERIPEEEGGDAHASSAYAVSEQFAKEKGIEEGHEVRIVNPTNWSTAWSFPLDPNEVSLAVKAVRLKNQKEGTTDAMIAIGTAYLLGEDYPCTGRILLLEIVVKDGVSWEGRMVWCQECRAPVNAVAVLDGSLLVGIGSRLELCSWNGSGLTRLAFFDAPVFITSANVVKSFVLFGDFLKGIHFVWYTVPTSGVGGGHEAHGDIKEMVLLGKDFNNSDVYSTEFLVNGTTLRFIFADGGGNFHLQGYHRDNPDSWNGRKLIPEGSVHIGQLVTRMVRMRLCSLDGIGRQAALYGTMEGSIGFVSPLWDPSMFDRLHSLQELLVFHIPHTAGLNPISFRRNYHKPVRASKCGSFSHLKQSPPDVILDLDLIWRYLNLDRIQQDTLAQRSGTHREQIIYDLQNISLTTSFF